MLVLPGEQMQSIVRFSLRAAQAALLLSIKSRVLK